jgi:hypothetical protein
VKTVGRVPTENTEDTESTKTFFTTDSEWMGFETTGLGF